MKEYLHRHLADFLLEYIYFMKIDQPSLSEQKNQRGALFAIHTMSYDGSALRGGDSRLKGTETTL